jgi:peptidoglycan/LPS O-acetylase OafA/YrhL
LRKFYIRRAYRILPAAGVFILFAVAACRHDLHWYDMGAAIFYVMDFAKVPPWMIAHLWSVSVEEQFYFLWPGLLKRFSRYRVIILVAAVLAAPTYIALCYHLKVRRERYGAFLSVVDTLAIGCLLAIFSSRIPKIRSHLAVLMLAAVILVPFYPAGIVPAREVFNLFVLSPSMYFSMAGLLLHAVQRPYWILNIPPIVWLGRLSYSLYLWQQPFFFDPARRPTYRLPLGIGLACASTTLWRSLALRCRRREAPRPISRPDASAKMLKFYRKPCSHFFTAYP